MITDNMRYDDFHFYRFHRDDICYLDNAATSMICVQAREEQWNADVWDHANPFRGTYPLSQKATDRYEWARKTVAEFINAEPEEIIFTRNATESLNLAAWIVKRLYPDGDVLISETCHHSAIFPWVWPNGYADYITPDVRDGSVGLNALYDAILHHPDASTVVIDHVSNVLGSVNKVKEITKHAHSLNSLVVVDGAQAVPHMPVDVKDLDADFYAFSGHKMCSTTGIGVLYVKKHILDMAGPMFTGGGMVHDYRSLSDIEWERPPWRFEAGTPNSSGAASLAGACSMYTKYGFEEIMARERTLTDRLVNGLFKIPQVHLLGSPCPQDHLSVVSFTADGHDPQEIGTRLGENDICIRTGYHCARPLHILMNGGKPSCRVSLMFYNTEKEIDFFLETLREILK